MKTYDKNIVNDAKRNKIIANNAENHENEQLLILTATTNNTYYKLVLQNNMLLGDFLWFHDVFS